MEFDLEYSKQKHITHMGRSWVNALPDHTFEYLETEVYPRLFKDWKRNYIYPNQKLFYRALRLTPIENVKIVILGQDPYHTKYKATGLAFEVQGIKAAEDIPHAQPSLKNIYKLQEKVVKVPTPIGDYHAKQGVLLLNTALCVKEGKPNYYKKLWEPFTKEIINILNKKDDVIWILWGANAHSYIPQITNETHTILASSHPSPLSWSKPCGEYPACCDTDPFGEANMLLDTPINW